MQHSEGLDLEHVFSIFWGHFQSFLAILVSRDETRNLVDETISRENFFARKLATLAAMYFLMDWVRCVSFKSSRFFSDEHYIFKYVVIRGGPSWQGFVENLGPSDYGVVPFDIIFSMKAMTIMWSLIMMIGLLLMDISLILVRF